MTEADAQTFAVGWIEAWNSRDLERILRHYADDIEVTLAVLSKRCRPWRGYRRGERTIPRATGARC